MTEERKGRSLTRSDLGMSKREHFSVLILAGLYANPEISGVPLSETDKEIEALTSRAIKIADELILKLSQADREDS
jgi:hypothetical protein